MAKAIINLAILYVSTMMPELAETKFTIETKAPNRNV
jgi:DNA repair exonuclease SbcCD ATPase subunit